jgi:hypothetical protein
VPEKEMITIPKNEYETLLKSQAKLDALEGMGVDNWSGYGDAMEYLETGEINV